MIGRILVALGGTEYTAVAIRTAIDLAKRHGAELTGVTVVNIERLRRIGPVPMGASEIANELRDERVAVSREAAEQAIDEFSSECDAAGVPYEVLREEHDEVAHYLIGLARFHDVSVMGLRAAFEYGVDTEPHEDPVKIITRLITGGVRPIVTVPKTPFEVRRVMVAFSGSMEAAKTLRHFVHLKPWPDVETRIVTFGQDNDENRYLVDQAARYCRAHGLEAAADIVDGSPVKGVLEEADACSADVIVMGNSHRSALVRRVLGDTLLNVIKNSDKALFLGQ